MGSSVSGNLLASSMILLGFSVLNDALIDYHLMWSLLGYTYIFLLKTAEIFFSILFHSVIGPLLEKKNCTQNAIKRASLFPTGTHLFCFEDMLEPLA